MEHGAGAALAVLAGAFRGAELDVLLGAGERAVQLRGVDAEVVALGRANKHRAADRCSRPFSEYCGAIRKYARGSLRPCTMSRSDYLRLGPLDRPAMLETLIRRIARLS